MVDFNTAHASLKCLKHLRHTDCKGFASLTITTIIHSAIGNDPIVLVNTKRSIVVFLMHVPLNPLAKIIQSVAMLIKLFQNALDSCVAQMT